MCIKSNDEKMKSACHSTKMHAVFVDVTLDVHGDDVLFIFYFGKWERKTRTL